MKKKIIFICLSAFLMLCATIIGALAVDFGIQETSEPICKLVKLDGLQKEEFTWTCDIAGQDKSKICGYPIKQLSVNDPIIQSNKAFLRKNGALLGVIEPSDMEFEKQGGKVKKMCFDVDWSIYDEAQVGDNSAHFVHQSESMVQYVDNNFELNITLFKWNGIDFVIAPNEIYIDDDNHSPYIFKANDTNPFNTSINGTNLYKYELDINTSIKQEGDYYYFERTFYKTNNNSRLDIIKDKYPEVKDICSNVKEVCSPYNITHYLSDCMEWNYTNETVYDEGFNITYNISYKDQCINWFNRTNVDAYSNCTIIDRGYEPDCQFNLEGYDIETEFGNETIYNKLSIEFYAIYNNETQQVEIDPAVDEKFDTTTETIDWQLNQTEVTDLGLRSEAPILNMVFNTDAEGTYVKDNSIYNNYGTNDGATYNATCGITGAGNDLGGCYEFDGINDKIDLDVDLTSLYDTSFTVSLWLDTTDSGADIIADYNNPYPFIFQKYGDALRVYVNTNDLIINYDTGGLSAGFNHYAVVINEGGESYLYMNGEKVATDAGPGQTLVSGGNLQLGHGSGSNRYLDGKIDQVQFWDRELSADEILNLYNGTANNTNYWGKYANEGNYTSLVFYNETSTYWDITQSIADSNGTWITNTSCQADDNCVSYWSLDAYGDGNPYNDKKGSNHGTPIGTNNATGLSSGAMYFDGVDDKIFMYDTGLGFDALSGDFTLGWWVKTTDTFALISTKRQQDGAQQGYQLTTSSFFVDLGGSTVTLTQNTEIEDGEWHHILATRSGTNISLWIDNQLDNSDDTIGNDANISCSGSCTNGYIALGNRPWSPVPYEGFIDEFILYNKSLNSQERTALYKAGLSQHANANVTLQTRTATSYNTSDSGLVGLWGLNGDATDETGNNDGTNNGANLSCSECGVVGMGAKFDGVDDVITIADVSELSFTSGGAVDGLFGLSLWISPKSISTGGIIGKWNGNTNKDEWLLYFREGGDGLALILRESSDNAFIRKTLDASLDVNKWSYITTTYNGSGTADGIKIYINGEEASATNDNSGTYNGMEDTNQDVEIGKYTEGDGTPRYFNGTIDEVRIYNRTLSQAEIQNLYELGSYHIEWNDWESIGKIEDGVGTNNSVEGKFMQYRTTLNTDTTNVSPYLLNDSISAFDAPEAPPVDSFPNISLISPLDNHNLSNTSFSMIFNCSASDDNSLTNVSLYIDGILNETNTSGTDGNYQFYKEFNQTNRTLNWSCEAYDDADQSNHTENRTLYVYYEEAEEVLCPNSWSGSGTQADPCQVTECGNITNENLFYQVQSDIYSTVSCFEIQANNISLDLNSYELSGDASGGDWAIDNNGYNLSIIKNGSITGFGQELSTGGGIRLQNNNLNQLLDLNISSNDDMGIRLSSSSNNTLRDIVADENKQTPLYLTSSSYNTIIRFLTKNIYSTGYGLHLTGDSNHNIIKDSEFNKAQSSSKNIYFDSHNNTLDNVTSTDGSYGLFFSSTAQDNLILNSLFENNTYNIDYSIAGNKNYMIYNNSFGEIKFIDNDFLNNLTTSGDIILGTSIKIENNSVYLNSTEFAGEKINSSANITLDLTDWTFGEPIILKDGEECTDCYNFTSLNASTVIFNVTSWSNYSIGNDTAEAPNVTIINPENGTTQNLVFSYEQQCTDGEGLDSQWYTWKDINYTYSESLDLYASEGNYTITAYCNNTDGLTSEVNSTFETLDLRQAELTSATVTGTIYQQGEAIKTVTACINKDNQLTSSIVRTTIYYPNNTIWIDSELATTLEDGLYYYNHSAPNVEGVYLIKSVCNDSSNIAVGITEMQVPKWVTTINDINDTVNDNNDKIINTLNNTEWILNSTLTADINVTWIENCLNGTNACDITSTIKLISNYTIEINGTIYELNSSIIDVLGIVKEINSSLQYNFSTLFNEINSLNTSNQEKLDFILSNVTDIKAYLEITNQTHEQLLNNILNNQTYWFPKISQNQTYWFPVLNSLLSNNSDNLSDILSELYDIDVAILGLEEDISGLERGKAGTMTSILITQEETTCQEVENDFENCYYYHLGSCIKGCKEGQFCNQEYLCVNEDLKEIDAQKIILKNKLNELKEKYYGVVDQPLKNKYINARFIPPLILIIIVMIVSFILIKNKKYQES